MSPVEVVTEYFRAMAAGVEAADELFNLFADDAVYVEPFSGNTRTHRGRDDIETYLRASMAGAPPDLTLDVDRIDVDNDVVTSEWTCTSPAFQAPIRGRDRCVVSDGRIARLEVEFLGGPS